MNYDHRTIMAAIQNADLAILEELATHCPGFPGGVDDLFGQHWITHAIACGSVEVASWMLANGAIETTEGYGVLHSVIEWDQSDKYQMMRDLISAGADVNEIGIHGYTPAHMAAVRNDVAALKILHVSGADFNIRTTVDDYYTPLEEARSLNGERALEAITWLETIKKE